LISESTSPTPPDADTFIIHDNSSEIAKIIPEKYVEPLVIIARIQGFDGIDDYIIHLIKDRLEMFTDTRDNLDDAFQKYIHNMIKGKDVPNTWALHLTTTTETKATTEEEANDDDTTEEEEEDTKDEDTKDESEKSKI
jgi:hypothetical protein